MPSALDHILKSPSLPSLPTVAVELLKLTKDADSTQLQFVQTIQSDPAIAAKILQLSNSSFFGIRTEVTTIQKSVSMLGTRAVTSLALSFSIARQSVGGSEISTHFRDFWQRSVLQALTCELLVKHQKEHSTSELFLAGLMLDIGRLAMLKVLGGEYAKVLAQLPKSDRSLSELEREAFDFDHAEAGAALLKFWEFPPSLITAVARHHDNDAIDRESRELLETLRLTRVSSRVAEYFYGDRTSEALTALEEATQEICDFDRNETLDFVEAVADRFRENAGLFDADAFDLPDPTDLIAEANRQLATIAMEAHQSEKTLAGEVEALRHQAIHDPLTNVYNRAYFDDVLAKEADLCRRNARSTGLVFLDIDHFKVFNDSYGHPFGDYVLREVAAVLASQLRESDVLARYGGEEFVILARQPTEEGLRMLIDRLRVAVEQASFTYEDQTVSVTASIGAAFILPNSQDHDAAEQLVSEADAAMYDAKHGGRNATRFRCLSDEREREMAMCVANERLSAQLVAAGTLSAEQLTTIEEDLRPSSERIGELAVRFGLLEPHQVESLLVRQREERGLHRIGELAVDENLITREQLVRLLAIKQEKPEVTARVLAEHRFISPDEAIQAVDSYTAPLSSLAATTA